ncbi:MAG: hypothetical protein ACE5OZ_20260 [Candidatus Heimdallarchaeota archaeon]
MSKERIIGLLMFVLGAVMLVSTSPASAATVWTEDFSGTLDEWDLVGYRVESGDISWGPLIQHDHGFTVVDGALAAPEQPFTALRNRSSEARHDSALAYGRWSFDWFGGDGNHLDVFGFMQTGLSDDPYNLTGKGIAEWNGTGYDLEIVGFDITLAKFTPKKPSLGVRIDGPYSLESTTNDWHHIDITRFSDGRISVYFDSELILTAFDNEHTTSEKFMWASASGATRIDNVVVTEDPSLPDPTTSTSSSDSYFLWMMVPAFMVLWLIRRKSI